MLDHRLLRTPARHPLVVPTRALALAIAAEWEWQVTCCVIPRVAGRSAAVLQPSTTGVKSLRRTSAAGPVTASAKCLRPVVPLQLQRIQPFTMPLMSLAATALDQPKPRGEVVATMLQYLPTDSLLCRDEPGPLAERQEQVLQRCFVFGVVLWVFCGCVLCFGFCAGSLCVWLCSLAVLCRCTSVKVWHLVLERCPRVVLLQRCSHAVVWAAWCTIQWFSSRLMLPWLGSCLWTCPSRSLRRPCELQLHTPVLLWAQQRMGIRLEPTDSIFGACLGEDQLAAVENHLQVRWWQGRASSQLLWGIGWGKGGFACWYVQLAARLTPGRPELPGL